jgi:serine protease
MNVVFVFCRFIGVILFSLWSGLTLAQELPWHLGSVNGANSAPAAINIAAARPGSHEVVVAVVDSGVLPNHPSLSGRVLAGYDMIS